MITDESHAAVAPAETDSWPQRVNLILFLLLLFLTLLIPWRPTLWEGMADPHDYLRQSHMSLLDPEFYAPHRVPGSDFYPRTFVVPLFYKIAGSNPDVIVQMQKLVHCLGPFIFLGAFLPFLRNRPVKYACMAGVYLLMSWWNVVGWTIDLLSETISIALLLCWIASFLVLLRRRDTLSFCSHVAVTLFFAFSRDTWPYFIVAFYGVVTFAFFVTRDGLRLHALALLAFAFVVCYGAVIAARNAERYRIPLIDTIVARIVNDKEYFHWFANHGAPNLKTLRENYPNIDLDADADRVRVYDIYTNEVYQKLSDWAARDGQGVYAKFLITHPTYSLLLEEKFEKLKRIFAYNTVYIGPPRGYSVYVEKIFPLFHPATTLLFCAALAWLYAKRREPVLLVPIYISLAFVATTLLTYNGDAIEIPRHLMANMIAVQLIGFVAGALILDAVLARRNRTSSFPS